MTQRHTKIKKMIAKYSKNISESQLEQEASAFKNYWALQSYDIDHMVAMLEQIPTWNNHVWVEPPYNLHRVFADMEQTWQENRKQIVTPQSKDEVVIDMGDGTGWVFLDRASCDAEGAAMGHCGNSPRSGSTDRILSFRSFQAGGDHKPHMTFILEENGFLGEMRGRSNKSPHPKYHNAIVKLLLHPMIKGIGRARWEGFQAGNFKISDLEPRLQDYLLKKKPIFAPLDFIVKNFENKEAKKLLLEMAEGRKRDEIDALPDEFKFHIYDNIPATAPMGYSILKYGRNTKTEGELTQQVDALIKEYNGDPISNRVAIRDDIMEAVGSDLKHGDLVELVYGLRPAIAPLPWLIKSPNFGRNSTTVRDRLNDVLADHLSFTDIKGDDIIIGEYEDYADLGEELSLDNVAYMGKAVNGEEYYEDGGYVDSDSITNVYDKLDLAMRKAIEQILFDASDEEDIEDMNITSEIENGGDEEITDAFNNGVRSGRESGAQREMSDALKSWGEGGDFNVKWDNKLILSVPIGNLMDFIIGQGDDNVEDEFEDYVYGEGWSAIIELNDIDQPHYGWDGWDEEYAVERTEEELPEHVQVKKDEIYRQLLKKNKGFDTDGKFKESVRYVKKR